MVNKIKKKITEIQIFKFYSISVFRTGSQSLSHSSKCEEILLLWELKCSLILWWLDLVIQLVSREAMRMRIQIRISISNTIFRQIISLLNYPLRFQNTFSSIFNSTVIAPIQASQFIFKSHLCIFYPVNSFLFYGS